MPAILEVHNLEVVYNRVARAVQGVSLAVQPKSIVGIVGINGAGKTTTLSALAGFISTDRVQMAGGRILVEGIDCTGEKPDAMSRRGLALVPEREKIFAKMRTHENLVASLTPKAGGITINDIYVLFPALVARRETIAGYLSGGERQMLATGMALLSHPKLLMIDEFSLGLAPILVQTVANAIREIRESMGLSILFVEQNATNAMDLADYLYVMEGGRFVFEGRPAEIRRNEDFRELYLGIGAGTEKRNYRDVRQYTKKRRWFG